MLKEIITNPVIIGLVAGSIVYAYLSWTRKKYNEKRLKKGKKIRDDDKYDDIIIPIIVAILGWFVAYGYINYKKTPQQTQLSLPLANSRSTRGELPPNYKLVVDQPSEIHKSFTLVTNGIKLPLQEPIVIPQQQMSQIPQVPQISMMGGNTQNQQHQQFQVSQQFQPNQQFQNRQANLINPASQNMNVPDIFID